MPGLCWFCCMPIINNTVIHTCNALYRHSSFSVFPLKSLCFYRLKVCDSPVFSKSFCAINFFPQSLNNHANFSTKLIKICTLFLGTMFLLSQAQYNINISFIQKSVICLIVNFAILQWSETEPISPRVCFPPTPRISFSKSAT